MDYDQCVAHHKSGRYKGQRCKQKGKNTLFRGKKFKTCFRHYDYCATNVPSWMSEIVEKSVLGRYDHA